MIKVARVFTLGVVSFDFLAALAISQHSFNAADFADVLAIRVKVGNVLFFLAFLVLSNMIFSGPVGFYQSHRLSSLRRRFREAVVAVALMSGCLLGVRGPMDLQFASNDFLLIFSVLNVGTLVLSREICQALLRFARLRGRNLRNIVIIGEANDVCNLGQHLTTNTTFGYRVARTICTDAPREPKGSSITAELELSISNESIDEVLLALPGDRYAREIDHIAQLCEKQGVLVRIRARPFNLKFARLQIDELEGIPMLTIESGPAEDWRVVTKRLIDLVGAFTLLLVLAPILLGVALIIKLDSPGPVFFGQERIGLNRRRFWMYKFRTMMDGAHERLALLEPQNEVSGPVFKIKQDPRVTRIGRVLRRFSIDELPQLMNVLKGEMSLVGPRPLPIRDVERIDSQWHRRRFSVKPGITCIWQVNGRSDVSFDRWVKMDLEYIDHWSLELDFKILMKTIPAVLKGSGAY